MIFLNMKLTKILLLLCLIMVVIPSGLIAQFIYSKEGRQILNRKQMISSCLRSMNKDRNDKTALAVCECQMNSIDRYFTNATYKKNTRNNFIDIQAMVDADTVIKNKIEDC